MNELSPNQINYMKNIKRNKRTITLSRIILFVLFIALWQFSTDLKLIDSFIFSSPTKVVHCFYTMLQDGSILFHIYITLTETLISFFLVIVIGILSSIILWSSEKLSEILEPFLVILNSLPKSALAPLLIVWLGANMKTIIVSGILVAVFGSIINLYTGFKEADIEKIKLIYSLGGNRTSALRLVVLPNAIPIIISIMKVNIGLSLVGVVIGEFLAAKSGLGYLIIYGSQVFKLDLVIMSIVILCFIAMGLYKGITLLEKLYIKLL